MSIVFRIYKREFINVLHFLCDLLGLEKYTLLNCTMVITIARGINPGAPGWNIFRMVSELYQKFCYSLF